MARPAQRRFLILVLVTSFALWAIPDLTRGQGRPNEEVRLYGRVQWISSSTMMVLTDCGLLEGDCAPVLVAVNIKLVPLSQYRGLRTGDWVIVDGVVTHRNAHHEVVARSVVIVEELEAP